MPLLDYLPIVLVFISAIVGITGKTWDSEKSGLARMTFKGRCAIAIACVSLGYGIFTVYENHRRLDHRKQIAALAHRQIITGIEHVLKPLCFDPNLNPKPTRIDAVFDLLRSEKNLEKNGRRRVVKTNLITAGTVIANTNQGYFEFDEIYQLYDFYIDVGSKLITESMTKYAAFLSVENLILLETMLQDEFFSTKYRLASKRSYFELGLHDEKQGVVQGDSPWVTAGLHWFNAVYLKDKYRAGNYSTVLGFLDKAWNAARHISEDLPTPVVFAPC